MDLSAHTSLAGIAEAARSVLDAASEISCQIYLTGALARDLWLEFGHGIDTGRQTQDVDFAIECADWQTFEKLAVELEDRGLRRDARIQHRFKHPNGTELDLIPFGGVEQPERTIGWPPDGNPVMNLVGFKEVSTGAVFMKLPGGTRVPVAPLAAIALLKLLAWDDRRRGPAGNKDAQDLVVIAKHYLDVRDPQLSIGDRANLVERHRYLDELAGAELLGSDMTEFGSGPVEKAVRQILAREIAADGPLGLAQVFDRYEPLDGIAFVAALHAGFFDE